jgi:uncharacterized protein (TIGR02996 family)
VQTLLAQHDDPRRARLLQRVLDDPENDEVKRIYADELLEAGDPRGEWIQLELGLVEPLSIRIRDRLRARHRELRTAYFKTWFPYPFSVTTRGGFVHSARPSIDQLVAEPALLAGEPVVELELAFAHGDRVRELLASPLLPRIRYLVLREPIELASFHHLWHGRTLAQLRELNIGAARRTAAPVTRLGPGMPRLELLTIGGGELGAAIELLHSWPHFDQLKALYLVGELDAADLDALLAAPLPRLRRFGLIQNRLGDAIGPAIARHAGHLPALRYLELVSTEIGLAGVAEIVAARLPVLAVFNVRSNPVSRDPVLRARAAALATYVIV